VNFILRHLKRLKNILQKNDMRIQSCGYITQKEIKMEDEKLTEGQQIIEDTLKMFLGQSIYKTEEKKDDSDK
jgi:uncharacterized membrane protein YcgQ (UPF0703/DUF1980 family)